MKRWERVYKKNKDMASREMDNDMILIPIYKTDKAINKIYTLNETAREMWELIDGKRKLNDIVEELSARYNVPRERIKTDLEEFIKDMKERKAIE